MHTLVSVVGLPSHDSARASNTAPPVPVSGPSTASREISAITLPSRGAIFAMWPAAM